MGQYYGNWRIHLALEKHPSATWTFKILKKLPIDTTRKDRLAVEQRYINKFRSYHPQFGFNIRAASAPLATMDEVAEWVDQNLPLKGEEP